MLHSIPRLWLVAFILLALTLCFVFSGVTTAAPLGSAKDRLLPQTTLPPLAAVGQITAQRYHTCALTSDKSVLCWGNNDNGRLGDGTITKRLLPVGVVGLTGTIDMIDAGGQHTCVVTTTNTVKCWGQNNYGQLGNRSNSDSTTPVDVSGLNDITAVSAGGSHSCARQSNGNLYCWGDNTYGQVGNNSTDHQNQPVFILANVQTVALGSIHTCVLLFDGTVKCWGSNQNGQVGDGTTELQRLTPTTVIGVKSTTTVTAIAAVRDHTCILLNDGTAQCWGLNDSGQLGDGTKSVRNQATVVTAITSGISAIVPGGIHTCVLTNGGVNCWGANESGQLGNGTKSTTPSLSAVAVSGLQSGVTQVTAGRNHTCAKLTSNEIKCWGLNTDGQLGDNTPNTRANPDYVRTTASPTPTFTSTFTPVNTPTVTPTPTSTWTPTITPTPTPTLTPPTPSQLPDLTITGLSIELETGDSCDYTSTTVGARVTVFNNGDVAAAPFVVAVNGQQKLIVGGLGVKAATTVWIGAPGSPVTAIVDATSLVVESNETNNSRTELLLPTPPLPPTCTPTVTPTPTDTPTPTITPTLTPTLPDLATNSPTPTSDRPDGDTMLLYMPVVRRAVIVTPTPLTPTPEPTWRLVGQTSLNAAMVTVYSNQIFVGERVPGLGGGLYQRPLDACAAAPSFVRADAINTSVLGLAFSGTRGVLANYDKGIFFSINSGANWRDAKAGVKNPSTVAVSPQGVFYVGSQDNGVYQSTDDEGRTWQRLGTQPAKVNRIRINDTQLWIGGTEGVWRWSELTQQMVADNAGLGGNNPLEVWDFAFGDDKIYVATLNGVYERSGAASWQPFGLQGKELYSMVLAGDYLYVGSKRTPTSTNTDTLVWRRALAGGDWQPLALPNSTSSNIVRYLYDNTTCQGLLAATNDGVWLLK